MVEDTTTWNDNQYCPLVNVISYEKNLFTIYSLAQIERFRDSSTEGNISEPVAAR
jgi:hypothetical protein